MPKALFLQIMSPERITLVKEKMEALLTNEQIIPLFNALPGPQCVNESQFRKLCKKYGISRTPEQVKALTRIRTSHFLAEGRELRRAYLLQGRTPEEQAAHTLRLATKRTQRRRQKFIENGLTQQGTPRQKRGGRKPKPKLPPAPVPSFEDYFEPPPAPPPLTEDEFLNKLASKLDQAKERLRNGDDPSKVADSFKLPLREVFRLAGEVRQEARLQGRSPRDDHHSA